MVNKLISELLESGDTAGCDGNLIVISLNSYKKLQDYLLEKTGKLSGEKIKEFACEDCGWSESGCEC